MSPRLPLRAAAALGPLIAVLLAAAAPAQAAFPDLRLPRSAATPLIEESAGQPYWELQSRCAGMFAAAYDYDTTRRAPEEAAANREIGKAMLKDAIARLVTDRGLERKAALELTLPQIEIGRAIGTELLGRKGSGPKSVWNIQRSMCLDIQDAYRGRG